jgi:hypothetical protein
MLLVDLKDFKPGMLPKKEELLFGVPLLPFSAAGSLEDLDRCGVVLSVLN